jgi:transcription initiation factor TFIIIB Brf1 subunit/transcription initiation factor TFIIB
MKKKIIKPCPFCGSAAEYSDEMGAILCSGCGFYFECPTTLEESLKTWNNRAPLSAAVEVKGEESYKGLAYAVRKWRDKWVVPMPAEKELNELLDQSDKIHDKLKGDGV